MEGEKKTERKHEIRETGGKEEGKIEVERNNKAKEKRG